MQRDKFGTVLKLGYVFFGFISIVFSFAKDGMSIGDWIAVVANALFFGFIAKDVWDIRDGT